MSNSTDDPAVENDGRGIRKHPRQARAIDKRDRILDHAQALIHADGYGRFTVAQVARKAGVSEGTVYQLFTGRQAILYALVERSSVRVDAANAEAIRTMEGRPWPNLIRALADTYALVLRDDPAIVSVYLAAQTVPALRQLECDLVSRRARQMAELAIDVAAIPRSAKLLTTTFSLCVMIADIVRYAQLFPLDEAQALIDEAVAIAEARWRTLGAP
jgi:AcrR family transcriptional regulator